MSLPVNLKFSCAALSTYNDHTVKALEPDENGCYPAVLGCVGAPTRAGVIYDPKSLIGAMSDPNSRFNICLRDGNLFGEWGHPDIYSNNQEDIRRLLKIDESKQSHLFTKIWVDEEPVMMHGIPAYPIRALVKPCGPYGAYLEKSLRDPSINTSFSIRSLCTPGTGPDSKYEYRNVQLVVTFDAVGAPGYEIASKRYAAGNESFEEINVERKDLDRIVESHAGMEDIMLTDRDIGRIYHDTRVNVCGQNTLLTGEHSYFDANGKLRDCASIIYGRC